ICRSLLRCPGLHPHQVVRVAFHAGATWEHVCRSVYSMIGLGLERLTRDLAESDPNMNIEFRSLVYLLKHALDLRVLIVDNVEWIASLHATHVLESNETKAACSSLPSPATGPLFTHLHHLVADATGLNYLRSNGILLVFVHSTSSQRVD